MTKKRKQKKSIKKSKTRNTEKIDKQVTETEKIHKKKIEPKKSNKIFFSIKNKKITPEKKSKTKGKIILQNK